jgi:hypothetical protein
MGLRNKLAGVLFIPGPRQGIVDDSYIDSGILPLLKESARFDLIRNEMVSIHVL